MSTGNRLWSRGFRYHADKAHPDLAGTWMAAKTTQASVIPGVPFRPRTAIQRKNTTATLNTGLRVQFSNLTQSGPWTYITDISDEVRVVDSLHYANHDHFTVKLLASANKVIADLTNGHYVDASNGGTGSASWPNAINRVLEPEICLIAVPGEVVRGDEYSIRWVQASGMVFQYGYSAPVDFVVIAPPGEVTYVDLSIEPAVAHTGVSIGPVVAQDGVSIDPVVAQAGVSVDPVVVAVGGVSIDSPVTQASIAIDPIVTADEITIEPAVEES